MAFANGKKPLRILGGFIKQNWKRILIWLLAALACLYSCAQIQYLSHYNLPWRTTKEFPFANRWNPHASIAGTVELKPGESAVQSFTAMGNIVGSCSKLYLELPDEQEEAQLSIELWWEREEPVLLTKAQAQFAEIPEDGIVEINFPEEVIVKSAERYRLAVTNTAETENVLLGVDHSVQSGVLHHGQEKIDGALTYGFQRTSMYTPSALVPLLSFLTSVTVLTGLALVLFGNVKTHVLYFILAVGFGVVTLFDLTPLYGFDMRFQFDSAYVVSNELMGLEGEIRVPSRENPEKMTSAYYRRACDDYSMFQFYEGEWVSDNYTDMVAGIKHLRATEDQKELILVETNQGYLSDNKYTLYLPQAIGFTIGRLLGLGFLPMVQLGRIVPYMLFVLLMTLAIRSVPFGKRMFLILALAPAVMTQTVSINRDGIIFGLSFFLIAKVLQAAYAEKRPSLWSWIVMLGLSLLLAPCKLIYVPVSFLWLLVVYRHYIHGRKVNWLKAGLATLAGFMVVICGLLSLTSISVVALITGSHIQGEPTVYTLSYVLSHLSRTCTVLWNTLRVELGSYLVNGVQLFDIKVGSSDGMTLLILFLLLIECCHDSEEYRVLRRGERYFSLLVAVGVFMLMVVAALEWTSVTSFTVFGIQGRYFTPVLPLLGVFLMNNRLLRVKGKTERLVNIGCCIFPAIYLMNMYLWTISR